MSTRLFSIFFLTLWLAAGFARAQGTAFTYQGRLNDGPNAATGIYDLRFAIYDAAGGGAPQGATLTNAATVVSNGQFTVTLDFGNQFPGANRWLEIGVRTNGLGNFFTLAPRQKITPAPYAVFAGNVSAAGITGPIADGQLSANVARLNGPAAFTGPVSFSNATGTFTGNGVGMTNLNIASGFGGGVNFQVGTLAFYLSSSPVVAEAPQDVTTADVNGDGKPDLISVHYDAGILTVLTNNGQGSFGLSSSPAVGVGPVAVVAADVNGDGWVDLITGHDAGSTLTVLTNNGSGGFVLSSSPAAGDRPHWVAAADINGDGKVDLIGANYSTNTLSVLTNNGRGLFAIASSPTVGTAPYSVTAADVNGDGKLDLISANIGANTLSVLTNNGSGGFVLSSSPGVGGYPQVVAAADFNGDGKADLVSANQDNTLTVLTNNGSGGFVLSSSPTPGYWPIFVIAVDVNGDGKVDLVSALYSAASMAVLTNDGHGSFSFATSPPAGLGPIAVAAADFNGDGRVDLVSANYGGSGNTLSVMFNSRQLNGVFTGNGTGLSGVNAESFDGFDSSDFARLTADQTFTGQNSFAGQSLFYNGTYFNGSSGFNGPSYFSGLSSFNDTIFQGASTFQGNMAVGNSASLSFGSQTRQMLNLWGVQYGLGVQSGTLYFRSDNSAANNGFAWYRGGTHSDTVQDPGAGGSSLMTLDANRLSVNTVVGLGTANPAAKLHLYSTDNPTTFRIQSAGTPGFGRIEFVSNPQGDPFEWRPAYIQSLDAGGFTGGLGFYLNGAGNTFGNVEVMRLVNGAVGIGVNAPQQQLSVATGMNLDQNDSNAGTVANTLRFGSGSGEAIGSKRTVGGNRWGLDFYTGGADRMVILNNGNVGIGTTTPSSALQVIGTVTATAFNPPSDRNLKENFAPVSPREVLEKVAALPVSRWNFKGDAATPHVGPMAQDFHAAFGLGTDDRHIATVDADGVALAAIQGLNEKVEARSRKSEERSRMLERQLAEKDTEITGLKERLEKLERWMGQNNSGEK